MNTITRNAVHDIFTAYQVAADSSSLILLNKISVLHMFCDRHRVLIPPGIKDELYQGCNSYEISIYKDLIHNNKLDVVESYPAECLHALPGIAGTLSNHDRSVLDLYAGMQCHALVTDDKKICQQCRNNTIPHMNALTAVLKLACEGTISNNEFDEKIAKLYEIGRYGASIKRRFEKMVTCYNV